MIAPVGLEPRGFRGMYVQNTSKNPRHLFGVVAAPGQYVKAPAKVSARDLRALERAESQGHVKMSDKGKPTTIKGETPDGKPVSVELAVLEGKEDKRRNVPVRYDVPPPPPPPPTKG